jgi:hypothetical protein
VIWISCYQKTTSRSPSIDDRYPLLEERKKNLIFQVRFYLAARPCGPCHHRGSEVSLHTLAQQKAIYIELAGRGDISTLVVARRHSPVSSVRTVLAGKKRGRTLVLLRRDGGLMKDSHDGGLVVYTRSVVPYLSLVVSPIELVLKLYNMIAILSGRRDLASPHFTRRRTRAD